MKIWVYTLCYNEMKILPYIVKYWQQYADKVIVYDNGSTDGSLKFLKKFDFIELRHFESDGMNDLIHKNIKNHVWKEAKAFNVDYVQVCDLDEVLYSPVGVKECCKLLKDNKIDVWKSNWIEIVGENLPTEINEDYYHKSKGFYGVYLEAPNGQPSKSKFVLFNPNIISETNFEVGSHSANFQRIDNNSVTYGIMENGLFALHFDKLGIDYLQWKYKSRNKRLSKLNREYGWGIQYTYNDAQIKEELNMYLQHKLDISDL